MPLDDSGARAGEPERLTTGLNVHTLSLSEDGKTLSYSVLTTNQNIWSIPIPEEGPVSVTEANPVTTGSQAIEGIHVSPDGQWIVFDSNRSGNQDIYKMPLEGGDLVQLTTDPAEDFLPAWSPDMKEIVFYSYRTGNPNIFVMSAEGGTSRQLTNDPGRDAHPDWSSDGKMIAFHSDRSGQVEVYALSVEKDELSGGASQPLRLTSAGGFFPKWSPNGAFVAFSSGSDVSVVPAEGGAVRLLATDVGLTNQGWSSDGQTIYYKPPGPERSSIWSVPRLRRRREALGAFRRSRSPVHSARMGRRRRAFLLHAHRARERHLGDGAGVNYLFITVVTISRRACDHRGKGEGSPVDPIVPSLLSSGHVGFPSCDARATLTDACACAAHRFLPTTFLVS